MNFYVKEHSQNKHLNLNGSSLITFRIIEYKRNIHCWDFHGLLIAKSISSCEIKIIYIPFQEQFSKNVVVLRVTDLKQFYSYILHSILTLFK